MSARQCAATELALALVAAGHGLRESARAAGIAPSTLVRARARHNLPPLRQPKVPASP